MSDQPITARDRILQAARALFLEQGYNGSQCWDTSFAVQAFVEAGLGTDPKFAPTLARSWRYFERTQILSPPEARLLRLVQARFKPPLNQ